ncbi:MAG: EAL domain-containing protein, partial [Sulfuriferula sp.]
AEGGTAGLALQTNKILFNPDYAHTEHAMPEFINAGLLANLLIPLGTDTEKLGVLAISWFTHKPRHPPSDSTLEAIQLLADMMYHKLHHKQMEAQLTQQAQRDMLTGLPNRKGVIAFLTSAMASSRQQQSLTAVVMLDLDDFKPINDNYGHAAGDAVLIQLADRIRQSLRDDDYAARLGGDEFLLILKDLPNQVALETLLTRLDANLTPAYQLHTGTSLHCQVSMGITIFPHDDHAADSLIRHADRALYDAKQQKRDRTRAWVYYAPAAHKEQAKRCKDLTTDLARNLVLHYQPIVDVSNQKLVRLEVLARLQENDNLLMPNEFLHFFGKTACAQLFFAVLNLSLAQLQLWDKIGFRPDIAINVSPFLLRDPDAPIAILNALQQHQIQPQRLTLDILEQEQVLSETDALNILNQLHHLGIRLALDDLGTAYSSLMRLRDLPIDEIKLDQIFIRELDKRIDDLPFVLAIKDLAQNLNIELIAEGVETPQIHAVLSQLGITRMQGYSICKPMPAAMLVDNLTHCLTTLVHPVDVGLISTYAQHLAIESSFLNLLQLAPQFLHADHLDDLKLCPLLPQLEPMPEIWRLHQHQHRLLHQMTKQPQRDINAQIHEYKTLGMQIRHLLMIAIADERDHQDALV